MSNHYHPTCYHCRLANYPDIIYQDDFSIAVIDPEKPDSGEILVFSRDHSGNIKQMLDREAECVMRTTIMIARAMRSTALCNGISMVQNDKAGHYNVRIIPLFHDAFHHITDQQLTQALKSLFAYN